MNLSVILIIEEYKFTRAINGRKNQKIKAVLWETFMYQSTVKYFSKMHRRVKKSNLLQMVPPLKWVP